MRIFTAICLVGTMAALAPAQQYEIVDPSGRVAAVAELTRNRLVVIENDGQRYDYVREVRYDSINGQFAGFFNGVANRVLRFPKSGYGNLFAADLNEAVPQFRQTIRTVRPRQGVTTPLPTLPPDYVFNPPGFGLPGYIPPGYINPGYGGAYDYGYYAPQIARSQSILIDTEFVPNAPLPPVTVNLANSASRDLQVELVGLVKSVPSQRIRLTPGESRPVTLQRDNGGQRIDYYRVINPYGETFTKQITTPVPPKTFYEVVVHEWALQSIAIDRTGKSPNAIEDISFQGKGIGRFPLPAGGDLTSTTIDVKRLAQAAGNPGAVAPLVPSNQINDRPSDEPLDRALQDVLQQQRRAAQRTP
jgi:hypothetical protein